MRKLSWLIIVMFLLLGCSNVVTVVETQQIEQESKNIPFAKLLDEETDERKTDKVKEESSKQDAIVKKQVKKEKAEEKNVSYKKSKEYTYKIKSQHEDTYVLSYDGKSSYFEDADEWKRTGSDFYRFIIREDKNSMTELVGESDHIVGLPYRLEIGNTFETVDGIDKITDLDLEIRVKAGTFDKVVEMSGDGGKTYFAPDAGKILSVGSNGEVYYELLEMNKR